MMKNFGDEIRPRLLAPAAHLLPPVRSKRRERNVRQEPVRAEPPLLVFSRQERQYDVTEVVRASGEHGGYSILPIVPVSGRVRRAKALAYRYANLIPDGRTAKSRKLAGEHQVDRQRHIDQLHAGANLLLVNFASAVCSARASATMRSGSAHPELFT